MEAIQILAAEESLVILAEFPNVSPDQLFEYWTQPALLCQWWPVEAEVEPRQDGAFQLSWPLQNWSLVGHFSVFTPGQELGFPWQWTHMHYTLSKHVRVDFEPLQNTGCILQLIHGPYSASEEDRQAYEEHLAGWQYFLPRLQALLKPASEKETEEDFE